VVAVVVVVVVVVAIDINRIDVDYKTSGCE